MAEKQVAKRKRHSGMWQPGQSGNPGGRPKRPDRERYAKIMREVLTDDKWAEICNRAVKDAIDGSHPARRWLADYSIGPPIKQSELTVTGDTSLVGVALDKRLALMASMLMAVIEKQNTEQERIESAETMDIVDGTILDGSTLDEST